MSALRKKQSIFARNVAALLEHAHLLGYDVTLGEVYRSDEQAEINAIGFNGREALAQLIEHQFPLLAKKIRNNTGNGIRNSVHMSRLAIDLQLFDRDTGKWLTHKYPYELLADFWEPLHPDNRAGVHWGDTPHYSMEHEGAK